MKAISSPLKTHIASDTLYLATLWKITRKDGVVQGFTDHDRDLAVDDGSGLRTYVAAGGFTRTAIEASRALNVDNLDLQGFFDSAYISEEDLVAGKYDGARIEISECNFEQPSAGVIKLRKGVLGQITVQDGLFVAELRGLSQMLQQKVGETYMPTCTANLGDARCKVDLGSLTETGTVASVVSRTSFTVSGLSSQSDGYWAAGLVTFTSGANDGLKIEAKAWTESSATLDLYFPVAFDLEVGDTFTVYPGCHKRLKQDCRDKFDNVINFRGFPFVPTDDKIRRVPDAN